MADATLSPSPTLAAIYRYPVKGLSPESLATARLEPGQTLAGDRRYAIENGPSGFDPASPSYLPKTQFLMLMRNERLAQLRTRFDDATGRLTIHRDGEMVAEGNLGTEDGRTAIERFFATFCADDLRGPPRLLESAGHSFSDVARKVVSIINLASVDDLAARIGRPVDPLRFRGNFYVRGWPAWAEFDFLNRVIAIGDVRLKVVKRIVRCAATNVDPATAQRDLNIPKSLMDGYGHADCGIYAEVIGRGTIAPGDRLLLP